MRVPGKTVAQEERRAAAQGLSAHAPATDAGHDRGDSPLTAYMESPSAPYPSSSRNTRASRLALALSDLTACRRSR